MVPHKEKNGDCETSEGNYDKRRHFHTSFMFVFSFRNSHHTKVISLLSNTCPFVVHLNLTTTFPACFQSVNAIGTNGKTVVA